MDKYEVKIAWDDESQTWYSECEDVGLYLCDPSLTSLVKQNKELSVEFREFKKEPTDFALDFKVDFSGIQELLAA
jgi:hypothetical protein